jgi:hypothetical protein
VGRKVVSALFVWWWSCPPCCLFYCQRLPIHFLTEPVLLLSPAALATVADAVLAEAVQWQTELMLTSSRVLAPAALAAAAPAVLAVAAEWQGEYCGRS